MSSAAQLRETPGARSQAHPPAATIAALLALRLLMIGRPVRKNVTRVSI
jgi:hypothetical protein